MRHEIFFSRYHPISGNASVGYTKDYQKYVSVSLQIPANKFFDFNKITSFKSLPLNLKQDLIVVSGLVRQVSPLNRFYRISGFSRSCL